MAIFFASVALLPIVLYLSLVTGGGGSFSAYLIIFLFTEILRITGGKLTVQEVFIIYFLMGAASGWVPFLDFVWRAYFMKSPITWRFKDPYTGLPIPLVAPSWWAPPLDSTFYKQPGGITALLHPDWLLPIALAILGWIFWYLIEISLSLLCAQLYIESERLPFPLATVDAQMIITLAERDPDRVRPFFIGGFIGVLWGLIAYTIPTLTSYVLYKPMIIVPLPWADLSSVIEKFLPGAALGISTTLSSYTIGFFLPTSLVLQMLIGSLGIYIIGNWITLTYFSSYFPRWRMEWTPGMPLNLIWERSYLWVWASFHVGFLLAVAIIPTLLRGKHVWQALKSISKLSESSKKAGYLPLPVILAMFFAGTVGSLIVFHIFVPDFPLWIAAAFTIGWTFIFALASARALGTVGTGIPQPSVAPGSGNVGAFGLSIPYVWLGCVLFSGYQKPDIWFFHPYVGGDDAAGFCYIIKVAQLTKTKFIDYFKGLIIIFPLVWIMSLIYTGFFWSIAPIPSAAYPWTAASWPISLSLSNLWISRSLETFKPQIILGSFIGMSLIGFIGNLILGSTFSLIGLVTGTMTLPPISIGMIVGNLFGRLLARWLGKERWVRIRAPLVAGEACGEGIMIGIGVALVLIAKSMWSLQY